MLSGDIRKQPASFAHRRGQRPGTGLEGDGASVPDREAAIRILQGSVSWNCQEHESVPHAYLMHKNANTLYCALVPLVQILQALEYHVDISDDNNYLITTNHCVFLLDIIGGYTVQT